MKRNFTPTAVSLLFVRAGGKIHCRLQPINNIVS